MVRTTRELKKKLLFGSYKFTLEVAVGTIQGEYCSGVAGY